MITRKVSVLGSTGSVGTSTLDLMAAAEATGSGRFEVEVLTGGRNVGLLAEQCLRWNPKLAVIENEVGRAELAERLAGSGIEVGGGSDAIV
ncbi:MAG: 1-deoxy-D-xylulose-5-phosphate reductoisomerase, partial [Brevundimonas sp.]